MVVAKTGPWGDSPVSAIHANYANRFGESLQNMSSTDKIAGLREILALDAKSSFARYGIAMELAGRGDAEEALKEFDSCWPTILTTPRRILCRRRRWLTRDEKTKRSSG